MKKYFGLTILLLLIGVLGFSRPRVVAASTTTETVAYQVNKAETTTPSLANSFFDHDATVTLQDGQPTSVTLHLTKFASYIKSFAIGTQAAKITNATANTADLTFNVDDQFKQATVTATMSVMNMNQKADIVFAKALVSPVTQTVKFQVNKAGTTTPSLANSFFDHEATVTLINDRPTSVTLHLTKFASYIKSFVIGTQAAQITNATTNTADLTFDLTDQFANANVTATMSVMNMTQQADLVFAKPLWSTPIDRQPTNDTPPTTATKPVVKPTTTTPAAKKAPQASGSVTARLYQARNGQLTDTASAAQQFMSQTATVVRGNTHTTITIHTTGAEYIKAMQVAGQLGKMTKRHGDEADLVFTLANAELHYALPVTFSLSVPGAAAMTQQAFLLIDLAPQAAKVDPKAPQLTTTKTNDQVGRLAIRGIAAHAIDTTKAQQDIAYSVLDASGNATSTADQYFTHTAHIVKDATGYLVYLTVRVTAGVVQFTPQSVNGGAISHFTHTTTGGQDVWTFAFHVSDAAALDQLVPATIVMSVPMANIVDQQFEIQFAFAKTAGAFATGIKQATATNKLAKAPLTIKKVAATAEAGDQAATNTAKSMQSDQALPHLKKYPIGWELLGFVVIDLLIVLAAGLLRRRQGMEATHD